jgi:peptidyl-prolyl cis-trans isomerase C
MFGLALVLASGLAPGCGKKSEEPKPAVPGETGSGSAVSAPVEIPLHQTSAGVVARVDGVDVKAAEVTEEINRLRAQVLPSRPAEEQARLIPMIHRQAIENAINRVLLLAHAAKSGIAVSDADVENQYVQFKGNFPSPEEFDKQMRESNLTPEKVKDRFRENLLLNALLEKNLQSNPAVSEDEIAAFYRSNPSQFQRPEQVRASHILLRAGQEETPDVRARKRARADSVMAVLRRGTDFAVVARQVSEDPGSAAQGGDLNYFGRGQMVPQFEAAAFSLAVGAVSGVVETPFGYHIIKVVDRKAAGEVPLAEARDSISEYLKGQKRTDSLKVWLEGLRSKSKIEYADSTGVLVEIAGTPPFPAQPAPVPGQ